MKNTERKTIGATAAMNAGRERVELPTKDADVERFLLEKQADGKAANTIRAYHASLAKLANMATDSLAGLTRDGFTRLVIELNGSKSVRWHLVVLRMYLTWKGIDTRGWPKGRYNGNANRWKDPAALLTRDEVAKMIAAGKTLEQIEKEFQIPQEFAHYTRPERLKQFYKLFYNQLMETGY